MHDFRQPAQQSDQELRKPEPFQTVSQAELKLPVQEKTQHFFRRVGASLIGKTPLRIASGPGMASTLNQPIFCNGHAVLIFKDLARVSSPRVRRSLVGVFTRKTFSIDNFPGIQRNHCRIGIAMKNDGSH